MGRNNGQIYRKIHHGGIFHFTNLFLQLIDGHWDTSNTEIPCIHGKTRKNHSFFDYYNIFFPVRKVGKVDAVKVFRTGHTNVERRE